MKHEQIAEEYLTEDAEIIISGHGIVSRLAQTAVEELREKGIKAGSLRPVTLFPFPVKAFKKAAKTARQFLCVEMSNGQMIDDIKLSIECSRPVHLLNRMGGNVPTVDSIVAKCLELAGSGKSSKSKAPRGEKK